MNSNNLEVIRSEIMRAVKSSRNKSTELRLINIFKINHITGWRRNYKLFGHPDFVFPKKKIALFVDGCFWHGHDCKERKPKNNAEYWRHKIIKNINRDMLVNQKLSSLGWRIIRIWECEIKNINDKLTNFGFIEPR